MADSTFLPLHVGHFGSLHLQEEPALKKWGIEEVLHYTYRFEFQSRGTLHVHAVAWVQYCAGQDLDALTGRSGAEKPGRSPLVSFLEDVFCCGAVDVQCGKGEHCLLRYVAGYISKASDALKFQKGDRSGGSGPSLKSLTGERCTVSCASGPLWNKRWRCTLRGFRW